MTTGTRIKHYRKSILGWTLEKLSEESGVEVGTIHALEIRGSQRSKFFKPIAKALGLTVEQLEDTSQEYKPDPPCLRPKSATIATLATSPIMARWPFSEELLPYQWELLTESQKKLVEDVAISYLPVNTKQHAPEKGKAAGTA